MRTVVVGVSSLNAFLGMVTLPTTCHPQPMIHAKLQQTPWQFRPHGLLCCRRVVGESYQGSLGRAGHTAVAGYPLKDDVEGFQIMDNRWIADELGALTRSCGADPGRILDSGHSKSAC
jgi:hypothetical protein